MRRDVNKHDYDTFDFSAEWLWREIRFVGLNTDSFLLRSLSFIREITTILATVLFTADSNSGFRIRHRFGCDPTGAGHCQGILARFSSDIILDFLIRKISISRRDVGCKRDSLLSRLHFHHLSRLIFGRLLLEPRWNPRWTVRASAGM